MYSEDNANRVAGNNSCKKAEEWVVAAETVVAADKNEGWGSQPWVELLAAVGQPVVAGACGNDCE